MRNHEVTIPAPLLNENGSLREPGWSRSLIQIYDRKQIKRSALKIKEWDYYAILSPSREFGVCFTLSDDGYIGLQSVSFLDFSSPFEHTETVLTLLPLGKMHMPSTSEAGDISFKNKKLSLSYTVKGGKRFIDCDFKDFYNKKPFSAHIILDNPPDDTMVIATPWKEDKKAFYYNQKINCMAASGTVSFDGKTYELSPETDFGCLDWGRGVWTYDNTWFWGSGSGNVDGHRFGFNIGYGFGDTSAASENVIFYDGKVHKLDDITFHIGDSYTDPWTFTSSDGRFEMEFFPIIDRAACLDFKVLLSDQHQVFGRMNGYAVLDDGTKVYIKDFLCFAEKVHNKY